MADPSGVTLSAGEFMIVDCKDKHIVGVLTFHKPLALFAVLKHLQGFFIRYFHGKG